MSIKLDESDSERDFSDEEGFYSADADKQKVVRVHVNNGIKWGIVITKIDHLVFLICLLTSVFSPILLFLPSIADADEQCQE